jgi:SagB-type dehydrogenase family enzyme
MTAWRTTWQAVHEALDATAGRPDDVGVDPPPLAVPTTLALPAPGPTALGSRSLASVVERRRSAYAFGAGQPDLATLATLLHLGVGRGPRAGGLASVVPYLVARGPGPVPPGVHRVDLRLPVPGLVTVRAGDPTAYVAATLDQPPFATRVPLWVVLVADLDVAAERYPPRHYRTVHVDAGVALHGLSLVATALGLATCPVMGYADRAWARLLVLGPGAFPVVLLATGGGTA